MNETDGISDTNAGSQEGPDKLERDLGKAKTALDRTCWFLSRQAGREHERIFHFIIDKNKAIAFIHDSNLVEVKGSRKPLAKWIEIGRQLRLAERVIWLKLGQLPHPSAVTDRRKKVHFWHWFDGIHRVFVYDATIGNQKLESQEVAKRFKLHRRLWVLAEQGLAVEQLFRKMERELGKSTASQKIGEQLGIYPRNPESNYVVVNQPPAHRRTLAYSS